MFAQKIPQNCYLIYISLFSIPVIQIILKFKMFSELFIKEKIEIKDLDITGQRISYCM
jgi:hypothetical protein